MPILMWLRVITKIPVLSPELDEEMLTLQELNVLLQNNMESPHLKIKGRFSGLNHDHI